MDKLRGVRTDWQIVYIDGYWADDKEEIQNYKCIIGQWDGDEDDNDIFYYFDSEQQIKECMNEKTILGDFVVTAYEIDTTRQRIGFLNN